MIPPLLVAEKRVLYYEWRLTQFRMQTKEAFREQQDRLKARGLSDHQRWSARYSSPSFWASHRDYLEQKFREALAQHVNQEKNIHVACHVKARQR